MEPFYPKEEASWSREGDHREGSVTILTSGASFYAQQEYLALLAGNVYLTARRWVTVPQDKDDHQGITTKDSPYASVSETLERLEEAVREKGLQTFAVVDHSGEAERVGLRMQETKLLIFGSPKAGTPLMVASPLLALDLPLKALVWEDRGQVRVSYNATSYLARRYDLSDELAKNIAGIDALIDGALGT